MSDLAARTLSPRLTSGAKPLMLKSNQFRKAREETWLELEALVARAEKRGVLSLGAEELERLSVLYRSTLSCVSVARASRWTANLLNYLEALSGPRLSGRLWTSRQALSGFLRFLTTDLPRAVRQARWHS